MNVKNSKGIINCQRGIIGETIAQIALITVCEELSRDINCQRKVDFKVPPQDYQGDLSTSLKLTNPQHVFSTIPIPQFRANLLLINAQI